MAVCIWETDEITEGRNEKEEDGRAEDEALGQDSSTGIRKTSEGDQEEVVRGGGGEERGKGKVDIWRSEFPGGRIQLNRDLWGIKKNKDGKASR